MFFIFGFGVRFGGSPVGGFFRELRENQEGKIGFEG